MRQLLIGFIWSIGFYFGSNAALGFAIGFQGGMKGQSNEEIQQAARSASAEMDSAILLLSVGAAVVGTVTQKLPGTKE